jgi:hypothetical protein
MIARHHRPSLLSVLFCGLLFTITAYAAQANNNKVPPTHDTIIQILSTQDFEQIKQLAKQLYQAPIQDQIILDKIADLIVKNYLIEQLEKADTTAWLCRAIGASSNGRYYTLLLDVKRHAAHKKVRKYAKIGLKQIGYATADQYLTN